MKTTKEMMDDVMEMKQKGKTEVHFDADENTSIFVETFSYKHEDGQFIAIEWRDIDTNETYESSICEYDNDKDIESSLAYIRRCALDRMEETRKDPMYLMAENVTEITWVFDRLMGSGKILAWDEISEHCGGSADVKQEIYAIARQFEGTYNGVDWESTDMDYVSEIEQFAETKLLEAYGPGNFWFGESQQEKQESEQGICCARPVARNA